MRLADFFVGKPGPGSMSEALHMGLPVVVENNTRTMIQERYNITWAEEQKLGVSISNFDHIGLATRYLLTNGRLEQHIANAKRLDNHAVFQIPLMLSGIMDANPVAEPTMRPARRPLRTLFTRRSKPSEHHTPII